MKVEATALSGLYVVEPQISGDQRGYFFESYNARTYAAHGLETSFVQDNASRSQRHVLRGLHYQVVRSQCKLVRVAAGEIFDVAVDVRRGSPTFGRFECQILSAQNHRQLWIPEGFAHGFLVLSEFADVLYKTSDYWSPEHERCIAWNDPELGIPWPITTAPLVSAKDAAGVSFSTAEPS